MKQESTSSLLKTCRACGVQKPLDAFQKESHLLGVTNDRGGMGVAGTCKNCRAEKRKPGITAEREERARLIASGLGKCGTCKQWLQLDEFNVSKASKNGRCAKCKRCAAEALASWRATNPSGYRKWYEQNKEEVLQRNKLYRETNRAELKQNYAAWAKANKHVVNALVAKRNARQFQALPPWADLDAIRLIYEERARISEATGIPHEVDHYYPLQGETVCGLHCEANLQIITKTENLRKKNRMPEEFYGIGRNLGASPRDVASCAGTAGLFGRATEGEDSRA